MNVNIGEQIRDLRQKLGLTQKELGEKIGKSAQVISNWERRYTPSITYDDIKNLSHALGTKVSGIVGDEQAIEYFIHGAPKEPEDIEELLRYYDVVFRDFLLDDDDKDDLRVVLEVIYQRALKSNRPRYSSLPKKTDSEDTISLDKLPNLYDKPKRKTPTFSKAKK